MSCAGTAGAACTVIVETARDVSTPVRKVAIIKRFMELLLCASFAPARQFICLSAPCNEFPMNELRRWRTKKPAALRPVGVTELKADARPALAAVRLGIAATTTQRCQDVGCIGNRHLETTLRNGGAYAGAQLKEDLA